MTTPLVGAERQRTPTIVPALLAVTAACWAYLLFLRAAMHDMGPATGMAGMATMGDSTSVFAMPMTSAWTAPDAVLVWTMWAVMMAAMMVPSAVPMVQAYATTVRSGSAHVRGSTPLFVAGYLAAWSGFALIATFAQWAMHDAALVDATGAATDRWLAGTVLAGAGLYQFTRLKDACLGRCRGPLGFLLDAWRSGRRGAVAMGVHHGSLCIGCCWALMALLFVLGVMNLWWIALVATVVLVEKITRSSVIPRIVGGGLATWGALVLAGLVDVGPS
jgi:predicted metal-binding membrane protein